MTKLSVSVVIPAWNSERQLRQNLPSVLAASKQVDAQIIVIDDHSTHDNTQSFLASLSPRITFIKNPLNLGFVRTVNKGVSLAKEDIIILLNTDVRPNWDCFSQCLKHFQLNDIFAVTFNNSNAWAGGWWQDGLLQHDSIKANALNKNILNPSLWASGGQAAFDRRKWNILGGLDPLYAPFYWEDVDLGYRAWKHGWRIIWDQKARVIHDHNDSVIKSNYAKKYINSIAMRNQLLFVWKNIHDTRMIWSHLLHTPHFIITYPKAFFTALTRLPNALLSRQQAKLNSIRSDQEVLSLWQNH